MKNMLKKYIIRRMMNEGYSSYYAFTIFKQRLEDFTKNKSFPLKQIIWAQKRGFLSEKIINYGLTEDNYRNYLSDFVYYWLHPINSEYRKWIDDKLTTKLILKPFCDNLPEYYLHTKQGVVYILPECDIQISPDLKGIGSLLVRKQNLAAKQVSGELAAGFYKLSCIDNVFSIDNVPLSEDDFNSFVRYHILDAKSEYLFTEYLHPNKTLARIWGDSPSTLRVMVIHKPGEPPQIVRAYWRFGSKKTGVVDNPAVGGVICHCDIDNGFFNNGSCYQDEFLVKCPNHPDTKAPLEGITPFWDEIKGKLMEIGTYLPQLKYLGYDIIITDNGFKIIEINSHQGIKYLQHFSPLLSNEICRQFFNELIEQKKNSYN